MKIKDRIGDCHELLAQIAGRLRRVEELRGARNPEESAETLYNALRDLAALDDHLVSMHKHYQRHAKKGRR